MDTFTFLLYYLPMYDITALCETGLNLTPLVFHYLIMHLCIYQDEEAE